MCISGEVQRAAKSGGDLREDCRGAGTWGHQTHEVHVLPGKRGIKIFEYYSIFIILKCHVNQTTLLTRKGKTHCS